MSRGASRYNPVMLLKVMIYCYMTGIYSSRQIAKQCRENINVMWLAGSQTPDFRTINKFRGEKYEKANATFNGRNSYSKTDEDATFMRMKEDAGYGSEENYDYLEKKRIPNKLKI